MAIIIHSVLIMILLGAVAALLLCGFIYEQLGRRRDAVRYPPPGTLVDVGGRRLHLLSQGTEGPTVVIEQGAGGPSLNWLPLQDQIARFARVCLYDRAGYLWSDAVEGPRSLEDRVKDLHALLIKGDMPSPYVLVAHSYGGFLVRLFARDYPDSVAGMVLVDTPHEQSYFQREVLSAYAKFRWMMRAMTLLSSFGLPRLLTRLLSKPDPKTTPEDGQRLNAYMVRREYFSAAADDIGSLQRAQKWILSPETFSNLGDVPLVVITHGQPFPGPFAVLEKGWREGQQRLVSLSTNAEFIVAEKSNHMIQNDEPDVVIEAVRRVVASARAAVASPN